MFPTSLHFQFCFALIKLRLLVFVSVCLCVCLLISLTSLGGSSGVDSKIVPYILYYLHNVLSFSATFFLPTLSFGFIYYPSLAAFWECYWILFCILGGENTTVLWTVVCLYLTPGAQTQPAVSPWGVRPSGRNASEQAIQNISAFKEDCSGSLMQLVKDFHICNILIYFPKFMFQVFPSLN